MVPADPCQPKYSLGQTQFCANQRLPCAGTSWQQQRVFWEALWIFFSMFLTYFFLVVCFELFFYAQVGAKRSPRLPKGPQKYPKWLPKGLNFIDCAASLSPFLSIGLQIGAFDPQKDHLGQIWGKIWDDFCTVFAPIFGQLPVASTQTGHLEKTPKKNMSLPYGNCTVLEPNVCEVPCVLWRCPAQRAQSATAPSGALSWRG